MKMNREQSQEFLDQLNQLFNAMYDSVPTEQKELRKEIGRAYNTIHEPDDLKKQIEAIPEGLTIMDNIMHKTALGKSYHFDEKQNKLWNQINDLYNAHTKLDFGSVINAWTMFH